MGRLPRPNGLPPEVCRMSILPFPVDPLPNPLRSSVAVIRTFRIAGPFETSTVVGLMLKLTSCGGLVSGFEMTVIVEGKPRACKVADEKLAVLNALSMRVRLIG